MRSHHNDVATRLVTALHLCGQGLQIQRLPILYTQACEIRSRSETEQV